MAAHNEFGKAGEDIAVRWLIKKEFEVLFRNWRSGHLEIDIIARTESCLHFIEVKTRRNDDFGPPEKFVTRQKLNRLMRAAAVFQIQYAHTLDVQYDILAITIGNNGIPDFFFVEDVYWW